MSTIERTMGRRALTVEEYLRVEEASSVRNEQDGDWREEEISGAGVVPIPCPAAELALEEIYEGL